MPSARSALLMCAWLGAGGCALSAGQPWGELVEASATARFDPGDDRTDDDGRLRTAKSYAVAVDVVVASIATLALQQAADDDGALSFDPADPPPGFTLCHNNDCHTDDGRILTFAEVEAQLAGDATLPSAAVLDVGAEAGLRATPAALPLGCPATPCLLERGAIVAARLAVESVRVRGIAFDVLGGEQGSGRLPPGGRAFELTIEPAGDVVGAIGGVEVERFQPVQWTLEASFALAPSLLDAIDFADEDEEGQVEAQQLAEAGIALVDDSVLDVIMQKAGTSGMLGVE